MEGRNE